MRGTAASLVLFMSALAPSSTALAEEPPLPSCDEARSKYVDEVGKKGPKDLGASAFGDVLNAGSYLGPCDVPSSSGVQVCVAVQRGKVVGATVSVDPPDERISECVVEQLAALSFPSHPKLDIAKTSFAPQKEEEVRSDGPKPTFREPPKEVTPPPRSGCGCAMDRQGRAPVWLSLCVGLLWWARRRVVTKVSAR